MQKLVTRWLSEHAQKLVNRWRCMQENWLVTRWPCIRENHFRAPHVHFQSFSCIPCSSVPFSHPCLTSYIPCLTSLPCLPSYMSPILLQLSPLSPVLCPLSHVSVPCILSAGPQSHLSVPILASHPLSPALRLCYLSPIFCPLFASPFIVTRPLYTVLPDLSLDSHPAFSPPYQLSQCPFSVALLHWGSCPFARPLFLVFHTCENASFSYKKQHRYILIH